MNVDGGRTRIRGNTLVDPRVFGVGIGNAEGAQSETIALTSNNRCAG